ncbi:MAG: PAS domain S-box protein [Anaerolineae bacterium]|nr:PAS domain S-box protein [Anaerolineae bacterium]
MKRNNHTHGYSSIVPVMAREREMAALRENQAHFVSILEISHEAIISIDERQRITLFNRGAERIFCYTAEEVMGQALSILLPKHVVKCHQEYVVQFSQLPSGTHLMGDRETITGLRKNGEEFPAEASISKFKFEDHWIFTVVLRDVTHQKAAETEREKLIHELDSFAHAVSHNLKAPLQLILGYTCLLDEQARLPDSLQAYLAAILRSGRKMQNIIDELQLLAGVRHAHVELKPLNMGHVIAEAQDRLKYMIEEYGAKIEVAAQWPVVLGHAAWVEEVWANYLSNGIKNGGHPPRLRLGATILTGGMVRFWVRDNGPGISSEAKQTLFESFSPLDHVRTEGYGLGLSIVRQIVEKLGGQVDVQSEGVAGQGAIFSFTLKQADPSAAF